MDHGFEPEQIVINRLKGDVFASVAKGHGVSFLNLTCSQRYASCRDLVMKRMRERQIYVRRVGPVFRLQPAHARVAYTNGQIQTLHLFLGFPLHWRGSPIGSLSLRVVQLLGTCFTYAGAKQNLNPFLCHLSSTVDLGFQLTMYIF